MGTRTPLQRTDSVIIGPDGKPVQSVPVVGAPKLDDLKEFSAEEMVHIAAPLQHAVDQGAPFEAPVQIELGIVCRLIATVLKLQGEQSSSSISPEGKTLVDIFSDAEA